MESKILTLLCAVFSFFMITGCGILPESCSGDEYLGDLSLIDTSIQYYPSDLQSSLVFVDEDNKEKNCSIVESIGEHRLVNERLCSTETDSQISYYFGEYKRAQYTFERERFYMELGVWNNYYSFSNDEDGINDVFRIYRHGEIDGVQHLKLVLSNRGNQSQQDTTYQFHKSIFLNGNSFSNVYKSINNSGYVFYYSLGIGVIAIEERGHFWVIKK